MKRLDKRMTNLVILLPGGLRRLRSSALCQIFKVLFASVSLLDDFYGISTFLKILDLQFE